MLVLSVVLGRGAAGVTGQEEERKQTNNQKQNGTINKLQEGYSAIVALQCIQQVRAQTPFASASHMQNYLIPTNDYIQYRYLLQWRTPSLILYRPSSRSSVSKRKKDQIEIT